VRILCSGYLVRYPAGGFSWHHLQYLVGFRRLGHEVNYFEHYGWRNSCYNPVTDSMTADHRYSIAYVAELLGRYGLDGHWCYLAEDGQAYGMSRDELVDCCRRCDVYVNLSNVNSIPEINECRRRVLVDTDPVFTQIDALGAEAELSAYHGLFTYGENVHLPGCAMPTGQWRWLPTRQPVVLDLWQVEAGDPSAPFTTVMSWAAIPDQWHEGQIYGQKAREFQPYVSLPRETGEPMEIAVGAPQELQQRLSEGGWRVAEPRDVVPNASSFQRYLRASRAEFSVAKHGYVSTQCGWFSDRSTSYMASGRPVIVQDTGFSRWLPVGEGVVTFRCPEEARTGIEEVNRCYAVHCRAARALVEEYFDYRKVLPGLLEGARSPAPSMESSQQRGSSHHDSTRSLPLC
jgi:hypothetical protein